MVKRYRPIPSQKRILADALRRQELHEWLRRREGLTWTAHDTAQMMHMFFVDGMPPVGKTPTVSYRDIDSLHMGTK